MCCVLLLAGFIGPRFALVMWWIFGTRVDAAFSTWVWPLLGVLFLPWTTLGYLLAWGPLHGVSGAGWLLVAIGAVLDLTSSSGRAAQRRRKSHS